MDANLYRLVKDNVTTRQAAAAYGLKVNRSGMACCIFHDDHVPSMKIDERYYCFSCHATGDVIDFTARLFNLSPLEAAKKLAADFGLRPLPPAQSAALPKISPVLSERKSQIGAVLARLFGAYAKDGSVGKISENPFARADLEHCLLCIDDDMRLEALRQTNYVKSIVTAKGRMDLERKGKQSYQGWMYARLLAFSNGDLVSLFDRSEGFFRRQLILTTKGKPPDRVDDPDIAEKMCAEMEGIFLWAFAGLQRLIRNDFRFTESPRARHNRELVRRDANNILLFMESEGYISHGPDRCISSEELRLIYRVWCEENAYVPVRSKTMIEFLTANQERFGLTYTHHLTNHAGRQVRGFRGIGPMFHPSPGWPRGDFDKNG